MPLGVVKTLFILLGLLVYVEKCMNLFSGTEFYKTVPEDTLTHRLTLTQDDVFDSLFQRMNNDKYLHDDKN